jgi:hypothetical protein
LIEINDSLRFSFAGQLCLVFMWCRKLDIGAHHACWLLLQAVFMTASVLTTTSTTATTTMSEGLFMGDLATRPNWLNFRRSKMNPE